VVHGFQAGWLDRGPAFDDFPLLVFLPPIAYPVQRKKKPAAAFCLDPEWSSWRLVLKASEEEE